LAEVVGPQLSGVGWWRECVQEFDGEYRLNGEARMLYYSHFVIASSVTTFKFLTDLQLLYLDAVDNFLNYGSLDDGPCDHGLPDHVPLDLETHDHEPLDHEPPDLESIDHQPASLSVPVDQVPADQNNVADAVMPVMSEPRLALLEGGKSDSLDDRNNESELTTTRSGQVDATSSDVPDEQNSRKQNGQENGWVNKTAAAVVVVAAGAALFETALLPGLALGVAAIVAPKYVSRLTGAIAPIFKSTVRATFKLANKPREAFAEAQQQIHGIIAEVRAEDASHSSTRAAEELRAAA
jgi:hypothetical protein